MQLNAHVVVFSKYTYTKMYVEFIKSRCFGFSFFRHFWDIIFNLFNYFLWLRITDEGSIPEMRNGPYCKLNPI